MFGIDPGTAVTGFGVIQVRNNAVKWIDSGVITTVASAPLPQRLHTLYKGLQEKIIQHSPQRVSIEEAFYAKNVHTTLLLGHARGVAMLAACQAGAIVSEYAPREIKKAVTGNGNATKEQVEYMMKMLLAPPVTHTHSDAYDALAAAMCDFYNGGRRSILENVPVKRGNANLKALLKEKGIK